MKASTTGQSLARDFFSDRQEFRPASTLRYSSPQSTFSGCLLGSQPSGYIVDMDSGILSPLRGTGVCRPPWNCSEVGSNCFLKASSLSWAICCNDCLSIPLIVLKLFELGSILQTSPLFKIFFLPLRILTFHIEIVNAMHSVTHQNSRQPACFSSNTRPAGSGQGEHNMKLSQIKWLEGKPEGLAFSHRSSKTRTCAYDSELVYSQVSDKISEFAGRDFARGSSPANDRASPSAELYKIRKDIKSIKEVISHSHSDGPCIEKIRQQILDQMNELLKEHREQTAHYMKQGFNRVTENVRKEFMGRYGRQFLTVDALDELSRDFQSVEAKVETMERLFNGCKLTELERKIGDFGEELNNIRFSISKIDRNVSKCYDFSKENRPRQVTIDILGEGHANKVKELQNTISQEISAIRQELVKNAQQIATLSTKILQLTQQPLPQALILQADSPLNSPTVAKNSSLRQLQQRYSLQPEPHPQPRTQKSIYSLTLSLESLKDLASPELKNCLAESLSSIKNIESSKYIIDADNYLLDGAGNYILSEDGSQVRLTTQQILRLEQENIVRFRER